MKLALTSVLLATILLGYSPAQDEQSPMYLGSAFVAGGFLKAGQFKDLSPAMHSVCIKEMDPGQIAEIISKYVREHPEAWHQD